MTIRDYLEKLPKRYRSKALRYCIIPEVIVASMSNAIESAFVWDRTKEWFEFWHKLYERYKHPQEEEIAAENLE